MRSHTWSAFELAVVYVICVVCLWWEYKFSAVERQRTRLGIPIDFHRAARVDRHIAIRVKLPTKVHNHSCLVCPGSVSYDECSRNSNQTAPGEPTAKAKSCHFQRSVHDRCGSRVGVSHVIIAVGLHVPAH